MVDVETQKSLALVAVQTTFGSCSGTMLNQWWVLTADHCVTKDGNPGGPLENLQSLTTAATWAVGGPRTASYVIRYINSDSLDVALIHLGDGNFGATPPRLLHFDKIDDGMTLRAYGRGIFKYADASTTPPTPTGFDGKYRTADLQASNVSASSYDSPANSRGQIIAGGDSGGPDYTLNGAGDVVKIAGVHSRCGGVAYVPGKSGWQWATKVSACTSAAVWPIFQKVTEAARPQYAELCQAYANEAMNQVKVHTANRCDANGRFSATRRDHIGWCLSTISDGGLDQAKPMAVHEALARKQFLDECTFKRRSRAGVAAAGSPGSVAPPSRILGSAVEQPTSISSELGHGAAADTCKSGYVWRIANPSDHVCVTAEARTRVKEENELGEYRRNPTGAYGPNTCTDGFVWRNAFEGDQACVIPYSRDLAKDENRLGPSRRT